MPSFLGLSYGLRERDISVKLKLGSLSDFDFQALHVVDFVAHVFQKNLLDFN